MQNGDDDTPAKTTRPANWNGDSAAMRALEESYGEAIRTGDLHAHELRQRDPKLYEALSQFFSRNKVKGLTPAAFADVMPVDPDARKGWRSRTPAPPPSPEEALAILLKQREADRNRKRRQRQALAARGRQADGDESDAAPDSVERPLTSPRPRPSTTRTPGD